MPNRIKVQREKAGLTQEALAELVKTSVAQMSRLESGKRKLTQEWMVRIAKALNIPPPALLPIPAESPYVGEFIQDRAEVSLVRFWRGLERDQKILFLRMLGWSEERDDHSASL